MLPSPGDQVEFYWSLDKQYYPWIISYFSDNQKCVKYDEGDTKSLSLKKNVVLWNIFVIFVCIHREATVD